MSNTIATIGTTAQALVWKDKKGTTKSAAGAVAQAFAPRDVRIGAAQADQMKALENGQFRPFMQDVRDNLSASECKALQGAQDFSLNPTRKEGVIATLRAVDAVWQVAADKRAAEGKKVAVKRAALHTVIVQWLASVDAKTIDADTRDVTGTADERVNPDAVTSETENLIASDEAVSV